MSRSPFTQDMVYSKKITTQEFSCFAIQVEGSFTGTISVRATISGRSPVDLPIQNVGNNYSLPDNAIVEAGIYCVAVAGLPQAEVVYSDDFAFTGAGYVTGYLSHTLPPIYIIGSV